MRQSRNLQPRSYHFSRFHKLKRSPNARVMIIFFFVCSVLLLHIFLFSSFFIGFSTESKNARVCVVLLFISAHMEESGISFHRLLYNLAYNLIKNDRAVTPLHFGMFKTSTRRFWILANEFVACFFIITSSFVSRWLSVHESGFSRGS
jgi:hypothetical protein